MSDLFRTPYSMGDPTSKTRGPWVQMTPRWWIARVGGREVELEYSAGEWVVSIDGDDVDCVPTLGAAKALGLEHVGGAS